MTDLVLSQEPASYCTALLCFSGRFLVQAVDREFMPKVCQTEQDVQEYVRTKHPLPCLVVFECSMPKPKVWHVLVR